MRIRMTVTEVRVYDVEVEVPIYNIAHRHELHQAAIEAAGDAEPVTINHDTEVVPGSITHD